MKNILFFLLISMVVFQACKKSDNPTGPEEAKYGTVTGKVVDASGGDAITKVSIKTEPSTSSVTSDDLGSYRIDNVPPGEYTIVASKTGYDTSSIKVKIIAGSSTVGDIFLKWHDSTYNPLVGLISGKVINSKDNMPVVSAIISTLPSTSNVITDANGNYTIRNVNAGQFTVTAVKYGFDTTITKVTVVKGQVTTANLIMNPIDTAASSVYGSIEGIITDGMTSSGIAGVTIVTDPATSSVFSDNSGKYTILNALPGKYKLTASKTGYTSTVINVTVIAGKTTSANFEMLTPTGKIKGRVIDDETLQPLPGVSVKTTPGTSTVTTDSNGEFEFSQVTPGTYTLTAEKTAYTTATVSIAVKAGLITNADIVLKR